ncbi:MAG: WG repeat-containing protein [Prevotellaceae bacterium]|jgi:tetratricopeptide (TPR) repeat protein|nr:WG repeat-containing protein [Prevotellaceae bacterium]
MEKIKYGLIDKTGKTALPLIYDDIFNFSHGIIEVRSGNKHGYFDRQLKEILPLTEKYWINVLLDNINDRPIPVKNVKTERWGYIDWAGKEIIPCKYDMAFSFYDTDFAEVRMESFSKEKSGFIDKTGNEIIPCIYDRFDYISKLSEVGVCAKRNGKYGVIDKTGNVIIDIKYDDDIIPSKQMQVKLNGKYGLIDSVGNEILPCIYDCIRNHDGTNICVQLGGKWGMIDMETKQQIVPFLYEDIDRMDEGVISVILDGKWGMIDMETKQQIVPFLYEDINRMNEGIIAVKLDGKWGMINKETKKQIVPFLYENINNRITAGIISVKLDGKWGMIEIKNLQNIIPVKYDEIDRFYNGRAVVLLNGKYGYIDETGKEVIPCRYDEAKWFNFPAARVKLNGKYGFIDETGKNITPFKYDETYVGKKIEWTKSDGKYGFFDRAAKKEIVVPKYDNLGRAINSIDGFRNGMAQVILNGKHGYIDETGKEVIPCQYDAAKYFEGDFAVVGVLNSDLLDTIRKYEKMLEQNPSDHEARYKLAGSFHDMENYKKSYDTVRQLLDLSPNYSANAWALRAQNAFLLGMMNEYPFDTAFADGLYSCNRAFAMDNHCQNAGTALVNIWGHVKYRAEDVLKTEAGKNPDTEQAEKLVRLLRQMEKMPPVQHTITMLLEVGKLRMQLQMYLTFKI